MKEQPVNDLEDCIADIWSSVLGNAINDRSKNFLDLGGSSLKMIRIHAELTRSLNYQIPITTMFAFPTIAGLARHLATTPIAEGQGNLSVAEPRAVATASCRKFRSYRNKNHE